MEFFLYILLAIVILLLMIVIHELGHYIAGKILKFKINEFSVGFGPKLISKKKKNGEVFSLRLIPLGGYCAFEDDAGVEDASDKLQNEQNSTDANSLEINGETTAIKPLSFTQEKPWKRIIVLISGGLFNLISAVIFSFICILIIGFAVPQVTDVKLVNDSSTPYNQLTKGDEIVAVEGKEINIMHSFEDLTKGYKLNDVVNITVIRNGSKIIIPLKIQQINSAENESYVGFGFTSDRVYINLDVGDAFIYCVPFTAKLAWSILGSFFDLITGQLPITSLTGPVGTIGMMAELSAMNWRNILLLLPLIAANLGLFNLLPIPALDGSKVVFTAIEWVRRKPISRKIENYVHTIGLFVLLGLVIIIDIIGMILR